MLDLVVAELVRAHEGREIGVEAGEGLRPRPLVLHDAEEIHHLVAKCRKVLGRGAGDLACHAAKPLLNELLEAPAGAVAGEHGQVVQMEIRAAVGIADLFIVNLAEPVVGGDGAGVGQDQPAHRVGDGGVFLDPPVRHPQVVVHQLFIVQHGGVHLPQLLPVLPVEDIGLRYGGIPGALQHRLHAVLDVLHADLVVPDLAGIVRRYLQGKQVDDSCVVGDLRRVKRLGDGIGDPGKVKIHPSSVPFDDLVHACLLLFSIVRGSVCSVCMAKRCPVAP